MTAARAVSALLLAAALCLDGGGAAAGVLDRIAAEGVLRAGTRDHVSPFAARDAEGRFRGFSVEMIEAVRDALAARLGRDIVLDLAEVDAASRIGAVESGALDITCDIASPTWAREARIDFSLSIFFNGTRVLVERDVAAGGLDGLDAARIGVVAASTTIGVVRAALPAARIEEFPDMEAALAALQAGRLDGISNISIILRDLQRQAAQPGRYVLLPRSGYLNAEPMACILPEDDSAWRDFVNRTIADLLEGVEEYRGGYYEAYRRWFGPEAELHYPLSREAIEHFRQIRIWLDG